MIDRFKATYLNICWLPPIIYLLADFYIATFEGWGQWAMGVVVLPALLLSAAFFMAGLWITSDSFKAQKPFLKLSIATLISGSVFLWFLGRALVTELMLSFS